MYFDLLKSYIGALLYIDNVKKYIILQATYLHTTFYIQATVIKASGHNNRSQNMSMILGIINKRYHRYICYFGTYIGMLNFSLIVRQKVF